MHRHERTLNEMAQGLMEFESSVSWFSSLPDNEQHAVLHELTLYISQAHPTLDEAREAVAHAGVKPTVNPAVMITREPVIQRLGGIPNLPSSEYVKAFRVLSATFKISDTRRRERECRGECGHAWHNLT
jgi:hypothetical protein